MSVMPGKRDRDSLAVKTMVVAGEEVAFSHPYITDAQRAAAGRETVAGRTRALLEANRERAAARYAAGWLADSEEVQRVWRARDQSELRWRVGAGRLAVWPEADVLHVLWRGEGDRVLLGGGLSAPMWPVRGAAGLWEASLRVRRLEEAVITLFVLALGASDLPFGQVAIDRVTWRGPRAPADHGTERPLAGRVCEHVVQSVALRAPRTVSVYVPPADVRAGPLRGCVLADGESTRAFAQALEPAIVSGAAPPVLLVGVHSAGDPANPANPRAQEYVPRQEPRRFEAHLRFVTGEVIPWATQAFPVDGGRWVCAGSSNGAAWAIAAARQRPDVFGGVAAFSAGVLPRHVMGTTPRRVRQYVAAGTLETDTRRSNHEYARRLRRSRVPCDYHEWVGGHDPFWWQRSLPDALSWLLG